MGFWDSQKLFMSLLAYIKITTTKEKIFSNFFVTDLIVISV